MKKKPSGKKMEAKRWEAGKLKGESSLYNTKGETAAPGDQTLDECEAASKSARPARGALEQDNKSAATAAEPGNISRGTPTTRAQGAAVTSHDPAAAPTISEPPGVGCYERQGGRDKVGGTKGEPLVKFRSYQAAIFMDRESGLLLLHWSRQIGKSYVLAAWAKRELLKLAREQFEFDAAKACMAKLPELKAVSLDKGLSDTQKVEAVRLKLFGEAAR